MRWGRLIGGIALTLLGAVLAAPVIVFALLMLTSSSGNTSLIALSPSMAWQVPLAALAGLILVVIGVRVMFARPAPASP